ncbi:uncharacterized protein METZ01_LOCUS95715 [marine metagenome]|uniref:Uncharacterized protein n=1 Tax=marine metagenome TaxID=408172 RepID=A0A381VS26_9ZZZZ
MRWGWGDRSLAPRRADGYFHAHSANIRQYVGNFGQDKVLSSMYK